jgi:hemerythrin-like domain-containing protein
LFATAEDAAQRSDWAACREPFDAFRAAMLRHFEVEENVLYPMLDHTLAASGIDLTQQVTACE